MTMTDIFSIEKLYPQQGKIKSHFENHYDSVFIAFLSFFKMNSDIQSTQLTKHTLVSHQQAINEFDVLKNISGNDCHIYSYNNEDYPTDDEICRDGEVVSWKSITDNSTLNNFQEVYKALKTSIGAYRKIFQRPYLLDMLTNYTQENQIWHPVKGEFDPFSKIAIYRAFKQCKKLNISFTDEFFEETISINLNECSELSFLTSCWSKYKYIYSGDKSILFAIEWDSFFFLIAAEEQLMKQILATHLFEGFFCDKNTEHPWEFGENELQSLLALEELQENSFIPKS